MQNFTAILLVAAFAVCSADISLKLKENGVPTTTATIGSNILKIGRIPNPGTYGDITEVFPALRGISTLPAHVSISHLPVQYTSGVITTSPQLYINDAVNEKKEDLAIDRRYPIYDCYTQYEYPYISKYPYYCSPPYYPVDPIYYAY